MAREEAGRLGPIRFHCDRVIGEPDEEYTLMVGNTGVIFVEGPKGRTFTLSETESRRLAEIVIARTGHGGN